MSEFSSLTFFGNAGLGYNPVSLAPPFAGAVPNAGAYNFGTNASPVIHFFSLAPILTPGEEPLYGADYSQAVQNQATAAAQGQAAAFLADLSED